MASRDLDLTSAEVVDVHCHGWRNRELVERAPAGFADRVTMMGMCLMSSGLSRGEEDEHLAFLTDSTPLALAMVRRLADHLGCEPTREAVGAARRSLLEREPAAYYGHLWDEARVAALLVDDGFPQPTITTEEFARESGADVRRVARIEPWIVELRGEVGSFDELEDAFVANAEEAVAGGAVAFKSVIAYRTGLDVRAWERDEARAAFERWRADGFRETREHAKPVRDELLRRVLAVARTHGRPVHVHCGGGDPGIVLAHARPQDIFPLLSEHIDQPVVLIHSGWPWLEEGAYVASILPHVYLDMSITMPWASLAIDQKLEVLLGIAPTGKVLYGSDEASEPEVIWLAAHLAKEALGRVLGAAVERRWLSGGEACAIGEGVLAGNARRLHGI